MYRIKTILLYSLIIAVPFLIAIINYDIDSFALAEGYTLDSSSFDVLAGGKDSAFSSVNYYGMNDPSGLLFFQMGNQAYEDLNQSVYNSTGNDISDWMWYWDDNLNSNTLVQNLSKGAIQSSGEALQNGFKTLVTEGTLGYLACKTYILAKLNDANNKVTDAYNNAYVYISDTFKNNAQIKKQELVQNNQVINSTLSKYYYGKNFQFQTNGYLYVLKFDKPMIFYYGGISNNDNYIYVLYPYNNYNFNRTGTIVDTSNGQTQVIDWFGDNNNSYLEPLIGSERYVTFRVAVNHYYNIQSLNPIWRYSDVINFINTYNPFNQSIIYQYDTTDSNALNTLLEQLKGKWVTSDDLRQINEKIDSLQLGNIVINNNEYPVIETDSDKLSEISQLIQQILNRNADINDNDILTDPDPGPEPEPEPEPVENINQGIDIPTGFNGDILTSFANIVTLPTRFFSVFEPLFKILGSNPAILGMWLFFPVFLLIMFVIWALK